MSDHHLENALRIADYLEDRMSPVEEEAFIRALGEEEDLRRQYEEELVIRGRMRGVEVGDREEGAGLLQPADEHLQMVEEILMKEREVGKVGWREGGKIAVFGRSGMAAAALLVIVSGTVLYIRLGRRGDIAVKEGGKADTGIVSGVRAAPQKKEGFQPDTVYARLYEPYASGRDPVEVSLYYQEYKRGDYAAVLAVREADYQVMGVGSREKTVRRYMQLYKGLSCLATGKAVEAIGLLEKVTPGDAGYDAAQWYLALAWLKVADIEKVKTIAIKIANSPSRYNEKAALLLKEVGS